MKYFVKVAEVKSHAKKVQVGNDQEKAQSEKDSHSKNRGGKNKLKTKSLFIPCIKQMSGIEHRYMIQVENTDFVVICTK